MSNGKTIYQYQFTYLKTFYRLSFALEYASIKTIYANFNIYFSKASSAFIYRIINS